MKQVDLTEGEFTMKKNHLLRKMLAFVLAGGMCCSALGIGFDANAQDSTATVQNDSSTTVTGAGVKADSLYNPVYNPEKDKMEFSYIYFGSYPQSEVTGEALTEEIVNAEYVSGEAVVDGVKYRRLKEDEAYYSYEKWREDNEEEYQIKDLEAWRQCYYDWNKNEGYHYFKYEPIKWRVIEKEDDKVLLLADNILDHRAYHTGPYATTLGWQDSQIRTWLNDYNNTGVGFMEAAFTEEEKKLLCDTFTGRYYVESYDKIFLLAGEDLVDRGIKNPLDLQMPISDYAYINGLCKQIFYENPIGKFISGEQIGKWWLRESSTWVEYVDFEGYIHRSGLASHGSNLKYRTYQHDMTVGVCPAIWLDLSNETLWEAETPLPSEELAYLQSLAASVEGDKADSLYNPVYNPEKDKMEFSYIYFGSYPQSEVTGEALTEEIVNAEYVSGEAVVEGVRYRRLRRTDEYQYFKYEPIKWRVIEKKDEKALLLADSILDYQTYHVGECDSEFSWLDSQLRTWINDYDNTENGFVSIAFTEDEKRLLCATYAERDQYSTIVQNPDEQDKIFIMKARNLWGREIKKPVDLQMRISDYAHGLLTQAVSSGSVVGKNAEGQKTGNWWLNDYENGVEYIDYEGGYHNEGMDVAGTGLKYSTYPDDTTIGVCPAITLYLSNESLWEAETPLTPEEVERLESYVPTATPEPTETPVVPSKEPLTSPEPPVITDTPVPSEEVSAKPVPPVQSEDTPMTPAPSIESEEPLTSPEPPIIIITGDTDGNGIVNLNDAQLALKAALKIEALTDEAVTRADVVKDGIITLEDAKKILRIALKIE